MYLPIFMSDTSIEADRSKDEPFRGFATKIPLKFNSPKEKPHCFGALRTHFPAYLSKYQ